MNVDNFVEIYSNYLQCSDHLVTATTLAQLSKTSHDKITRFLASGQLNENMFEKSALKTAINFCSGQGVLIFDDTLIHKPYSKPSPLISYHYDHCTNRNIKGIGLMTALFYDKGISIPVSIEVIKKMEFDLDEKGNLKRSSKITKNQMMRDMLDHCLESIKIKYVLADRWFSSAANLIHIKEGHQTDFIIPVKANRTVALSEEDKKEGKYITAESLNLAEGEVREVYLKSIDFKMLLCRQVIKDGDEAVGELFLVTSDLNLTGKEILEIYKKRWKIEEYHRCIKQNFKLEKSQVHSQTAQKSHIVAVLLAFIRSEIIKFINKISQDTVKQVIRFKQLVTGYKAAEYLSTSYSAIIKEVMVFA